VTANSTQLIQPLRRPGERIVHGTVGLVRVSSGWGAYEPGIINPQFVACLRAGPSGGTDRFAADTVAYTALSSLSSHISTQGRENDDEHQGGIAARKGQGVQLIN
jgi:hypothetical protein